MQHFKKIRLHIIRIIAWGIIIYSLTVVCFYFSSIIPVEKQLTQLEQKTEGLKKEVENLKSQYVKKWEGEKEEVLKIIDSFYQKKGDKDAILSKIFQISQDSGGIEIERTEPLEDEILGDTMIRYSWKISCRADYPAMGTFFNRIEMDPLFLCIESPSIQSEEKNQKQSKEITTEQIKHKVEFTISTYRFKIKE